MLTCDLESFLDHISVKVYPRGSNYSAIIKEKKHFHCVTQTQQLHPPTDVMQSKRGPAPPCGCSASLQVLFDYFTENIMEHTTPHPAHNTSHRCGRDAALTWRPAVATGKYYCRHGNPWTDEEMSETEGGKWTLRNEGEETVNKGGNEILWHDVREKSVQVCVYWWARKIKKLVSFLETKVEEGFGPCLVLLQFYLNYGSAVCFFTESCPWCVTCLMRDKVGQPFPAGHFSNKLSSPLQRG